MECWERSGCGGTQNFCGSQCTNFATSLKQPQIPKKFLRQSDHILSFLRNFAKRPEISNEFFAKFTYKVLGGSGIRQTNLGVSYDFCQASISFRRVPRNFAASNVKLWISWTPTNCLGEVLAPIKHNAVILSFPTNLRRPTHKLR